jgi:hypothetical protein
MDSVMFGAIRSPPSSCDERGKRLKQETESDLKLESEEKLNEESEPEPESDSDSGV